MQESARDREIRLRDKARLEKEFKDCQKELVDRLLGKQSSIPWLKEKNLRTNHKTRCLVAGLEQLDEGTKRLAVPFDSDVYVLLTQDQREEYLRSRRVPSGL
jgi:hypothetical protein